MTDIYFFFVIRTVRHFDFFKRAGRHEKGAGRRALQKKPRQNTVKVIGKCAPGIRARARAMGQD